MDKKTKVARLSIASNTLLIIMKFIVGMLSGSVSIISEAIHSFMDLLAAIIAFFSVRVSGNPPDIRHPYGHGKYENVSGVIEALLIFVAAVWIIYEAIHKILNPKPIEAAWIGFSVMAISGIINFLVSRKLYQVARETDSIALEADALHLKADVITSLGVAAGLLLIWITDVYMLDPIVAILVAIFILKESYTLLKNAYSPLVDVSLSDDEILIIKKAFEKYSVNFHDLKTRKSGPFRFADVHVVMQGNMILKDVHELCDKIESLIKTNIKNIDINIHVETPESN